MLAVVAVGLEGAWRACRRSRPGPPAERIEQIVLVVTIAGGLGLLLGGGRPKEILHFVYAIVALGAMPVADSLARNASPRRQGVATLVGALVALAVIARLFQTG